MTEGVYVLMDEVTVNQQKAGVYKNQFLCKKLQGKVHLMQFLGQLLRDSRVPQSTAVAKARSVLGKSGVWEEWGQPPVL